MKFKPDFIVSVDDIKEMEGIRSYGARDLDHTEVENEDGTYTHIITFTSIKEMNPVRAYKRNIK